MHIVIGETFLFYNNKNVEKQSDKIKSIFNATEIEGVFINEKV